MTFPLKVKTSSGTVYEFADAHHYVRKEKHHKALIWGGKTWFDEFVPEKLLFANSRYAVATGAEGKAMIYQREDYALCGLPSTNPSQFPAIITVEKKGRLIIVEIEAGTYAVYRATHGIALQQVIGGEDLITIAETENGPKIFFSSPVIELNDETIWRPYEYEDDEDEEDD